MKRLLAGFAALLFAAPLVLSAQAAAAADKAVGDKAPVWKNDAGLHETKDIIGTRIKGADGKDVGEVDQLLIDSKTGKVSHVVIGFGGLAGVGEKKVVVPWSALRFAPVTEGKKNAVTMDQTKLENAPRYERSARADHSPAASPGTRSPVKDSDRDGKSNATDRAPYNPNKQ